MPLPGKLPPLGAMIEADANPADDIMTNKRAAVAALMEAMKSGDLDAATEAFADAYHACKALEEQEAGEEY